MNQPMPQNQPIIVVAGSVHYDLMLHLPQLPGENDRLVPTAMTLAPGGMGGNVAAAIARLGGSVRFAGTFTEEEDGETLRADLVRDGVDVQWAGSRPAASRHRGMILVSHAGQRAILGAWPEATSLKRSPGQAPGLIQQLDWGLQPRNAASRRKMAEVDIPAETFAGENVAFACPFNFAPLVLGSVPESTPVYMDIETGHVAGWSEAEIWAALRRATVLYGNQGNLANLARRLDEPSVTALSRTWGGTIVETSGELGCQIHDRGVRSVAPGFKVQTVDTTGAGDCFAAACTLALRRGAPLAEAARFANAAAALSTRVLGSRPGVPTREELDDFMASRSAPAETRAATTGIRGMTSASLGRLLVGSETSQPGAISDSSESISDSKGPRIPQ